MKFRLMMSGLLLAGLISSPVSAQLSLFCSDFEDLVPTVTFLPIGDGWQFVHNQPVAPPGDIYFGAAPQGPQISNLADASGNPGNTLFQENGTDDGSNQYLNIFSDYNNGLRLSNPTFDFVNNVFQEQTFTGADAANAQTWTFSFDYAGGESPFGIADDPNSTAAAFIRVFDNSPTPNLLAESTFDTSTATELVFAPGKVSLTFDPEWEDGGKVQFGFTSTCSSFEPTGVYYDNVCFAVRGDANGDGVVDFVDVSPFLQALFDRAQYEIDFPGIDADAVLDINCDGVQDFVDVTPFLGILFPPEPS